MDGFQMPTPPQADAPPAMPGFTGQMPAAPTPPQQQQTRPPGRPSTDPVKEQRRVESAKERERISRLMPKDATDARILIYRCKGKTGMQHQSRPLCKILLSDIEESGEESRDFLINVIKERAPEGGRFYCEPRDARNKPLTDATAFELEVEDEEGNRPWEDDDDDEEIEEIETMDDIYSGQQAVYPGMPSGGWRPPQGQPSPQDPVSTYKAMRDLIERDQSSKAGGQDTLIAMMMAMDRERREDQRRREELEIQRLEKMEKEQARREDLERQRREQERKEDQERKERFYTTIATTLPAAFGVLAKLFEGRKKDDTMTPLLLKMIDNQNDRSAVKEMIGMTNESARQQMSLQSELTKILMETQGKASSSMLENMMSMMTRAAEAQIEAMGGDPDDFTSKFEKVLKIANPLLQGMRNQQAPEMPTVRVNDTAERAVTGAARSQEQAAQEPEYTDEQRVAGILHTLLAMEAGTALLDARERLQALQWMAQQAPNDLREAIVAEDFEAIMQMAAPVVMADQNLMAWVQKPGVEAFVREVCGQIKLVYEGVRSEEAAMQVLRYHRDYLAAKGITLAMPEAAAPKPADTPYKTPTRKTPPRRFSVGDQVRVTAGDHAGQTAQVSQLLDDGYVVTLDGGEEAVALPTDLEPDMGAPARRARRAPPPPAPSSDDEGEAEDDDDDEGDEGEAEDDEGDDS